MRGQPELNQNFPLIYDCLQNWFLDNLLYIIKKYFNYSETLQFFLLIIYLSFFKHQCSKFWIKKKHSKETMNEVRVTPNNYK